MRFFNIEVIFAIDMDMGIPGRPDMGESTVLHGVAFVLQLLHDGRHVDRMPDNDGMRHERQPERLMGFQA